jgi:hypothetical protein
MSYATGSYCIEFSTVAELEKCFSRPKSFFQVIMKSMEASTHDAAG